MKVLFLKYVPNVGRPGDVKEVVDGYGRNYLLPNGLAVLATPQEMKRAEAIREAAARRELRTEEEVHALGERLEGETITFYAKAGSSERLYGSITTLDIAEGLSKMTGYEIDRRKIELKEPIRRLGIWETSVRLSHDIVPKIKVVVEPEGGKRPEVEVKAKPPVEEKLEAISEEGEQQ